MPVGNIQALLGGKGLLHGGDRRRIVHHPQGVTDAILRGKIIHRLAGRDLGHFGGNDRILPVHEEHGAGLGPSAQDVIDPVLFFVRTRQFMFADDAGLVLRRLADGGQPRLNKFAHLLPVYIVAGGFLPLQQAIGDILRQFFAGLGVNFRRMGIGFRQQIDFRPGDPQKAPRFLRHHLPRFGRIHHIIRQGGKFRGDGRHRPQGPERFHCGHGFHSSYTYFRPRS